MNATTILAVAKAINTKALKEARKAMQPGTFDVDTTVRITGQVRIGEDFERIPTTSIPLISALSLLCHDAGITGQNAVNKIASAMQRALAAEAGDPDPSSIIEKMRVNFKEAESKVRSMLQTLPPVKVNGVITTKLQAAEVSSFRQLSDYVVWHKPQGKPRETNTSL